MTLPCTTLQKLDWIRKVLYPEVTVMKDEIARRRYNAASGTIMRSEMSVIDELFNEACAKQPFEEDL